MPVTAPKLKEFVQQAFHNAELCQTFAEKNLSREESARWKGLEAYYWGLAGEQRKLTPSSREFVRVDPQTAKQHATHPDMQRENPLYCVELCQMLAEKAAGVEFAHLKGVEAYCLALLSGEVHMRRSKACAGLFVEGDPSTAEQHAQDARMQQENPLYCSLLFQILASKSSRRSKINQFLVRAAELSLLACNIQGFRVCCSSRLFHNFNVWHFLMGFLSTHYMHASNVLILDHLVEEALKDRQIITAWAKPFNCKKHTWTGLSSLMATFYYHWEEISEAAKAAVLNRLALIIPLCREAAVWTEGVSFEGQLLDTPLRLMRLLLNKSPEDPGVQRLLVLAIAHAPASAWLQVVTSEERPVYSLFTDLEGPLQQAFRQRFSAPARGLAQHSVFAGSSEGQALFHSLPRCSPN